MTVCATEGVITLEGMCPVEDAEPLLAALQEQPPRPVDLAGCTHLHMAVFQVLLAAGAALYGADPPGFPGLHIMPMLRQRPFSSATDDL